MLTIFGVALFFTIVASYKFLKGNKDNNKIPTIDQKPVIKVSHNKEYFKKKPLFIETWDFKEFCKKFDRMQYGNPTNGTTGESFKSCRFLKEGKPVTYVGFYRVPGELSPEELKRRAEELKVGLKESGRYLIYTGNMPYYEVSDPIDLGIPNLN